MVTTRSKVKKTKKRNDLVFSLKKVIAQKKRNDKIDNNNSFVDEENGGTNHPPTMESLLSDENLFDNEDTNNEDMKRMDTDEEQEEEEQDEEEEVENEDDEEDEEDYFFDIPEEIKRSSPLRKKLEKHVDIIKREEPTLQQILKLNVRQKRKKRTDSIILYLSKFISFYRRKIFLWSRLEKKINMYINEYKEFSFHKKKYKQMEKRNEEESDISKLKSRLFSIKTTQSNFEYLQQKLSSLEMREIGSEEFLSQFSILRKPFLYHLIR